jgi:hypothetical protein
MTPNTRKSSYRHLALSLISAAGVSLATASVEPVHAAKRPVALANQPATPEILLSASNTIPTCVTPDRLDAILLERNPKLEAKFRGIAGLYKIHGEKVGVRWDYAFYQMILETNSLLFTGDVKARQNNFAGLGATGGGVPGESFADVSTGVLAQLQHLVAYAGQKVENPVAKRTRDNQDDIIAKSKRLGRVVRFGDLTNRWAADSRYARSIDTLAARFRDGMCNGRAFDKIAAVVPPVAVQPVAVQPTAAQPAAVEKAAPAPRRKGRDLARKAIEDGKAENTPPSALGVPTAPEPANCAVLSASFGGAVTLLIRAEADKNVTFTALDVEGGAEQAMAESYMKVHAKGGKVAGRFKSRDEAVAHAYALCDSGKP